MGAAMRVMRCTLGLMAVFALGSAAADEIQLKNGTKFSAGVVKQDDQIVLIALPKDAVAAINSKPSTPAPTVIEGAKAPVFSAVDLAGQPQTVPGEPGQVTLVQFWASWCPFCQADLDAMKTLTSRYKNHPQVRVLTVSIDQDLDKLRTFIKDKKVRYPVIAIADPAGAPQQRSIPSLFESRGVPGYYLIDAQGTIRKIVAGSISHNQLDLDAVLQELLKG